MSGTNDSPNLPSPVANTVTGIVNGLVPTSVKALDRLIGAGVELPVAWLAQQKAKIDAQTEAYKLVEASIAKAAAEHAGADHAVVERAVDVLVRKAYRKQINREAVATAMVEDLREQSDTQPQNDAPPVSELDDDWLNVFERYAEDASSERMQRLWGRVLAGEVRNPGRYSTRTLRFLSEFSQADALLFASFCESSFQDGAPTSLVNPDDTHDMSHLFMLESSGLIHGADGLGLTRRKTFSSNGISYLREENLVILLKGTPGESFETTIIGLTPLGQELVSVIPHRDARAAARRVAHAMRVPEIKSAFLGVVIGSAGNVQPMEVLWQDGEPASTL
jgi:hypothetical protein